MNDNTIKLELTIEDAKVLDLLFGSIEDVWICGLVTAEERDACESIWLNLVSATVKAIQEPGCDCDSN